MMRLLEARFRSTRSVDYGVVGYLRSEFWSFVEVRAAPHAESVHE